MAQKFAYPNTESELQLIQEQLYAHTRQAISNLASVCINCHGMVHNNKNYSKLGMKIWKKVQYFREKL